MEKLETQIEDEFHELIITEANKQLPKGDYDNYQLTYHYLDIYISLYYKNLISIKEFMTDELLKRNWDFDDLERVCIDIVFDMMSLYFSNPEKYSLFEKRFIYYERGPPFEFAYLYSYLLSADVSLEQLKKTPKTVWPYYVLNRNMTDEFFEENQDVKFDLGLLALNPNISLDCIKKWKHLNWKGETLLCRTDITLEFIFNNMDFPWYHSTDLLINKIKQEKHPIYTLSYLKTFMKNHPEIRWYDFRDKDLEEGAAEEETSDDESSDDESSDEKYRYEEFSVEEATDEEYSVEEATDEQYSDEEDEDSFKRRVDKHLSIFRPQNFCFFDMSKKKKCLKGINKKLLYIHKRSEIRTEYYDLEDKKYLSEVLLYDNIILEKDTGKKKLSKIDMDLVKSRITPEMESNPLVQNIIKVLEEKKTEKEILENENITLEFIKTFQELTQLKLRWYLYPLTFEKEKEIIRTKHYRRFLAAKKIENWWIKVNWDPKYAKCKQKLNKDYDSLFGTK